MPFNYSSLKQVKHKTLGYGRRKWKTGLGMWIFTLALSVGYTTLVRPQIQAYADAKGSRYELVQDTGLRGGNFDGDHTSRQRSLAFFNSSSEDPGVDHCDLDSSSSDNCGAHGTCAQRFTNEAPSCECDKCWGLEVTTGRTYERCTKGKELKLVAIALISWFVGSLGVDRCVISPSGCGACLGVLKGFTVGGLGIWWLVDAIIITTNSYPGHHFC